MTKECRGGGRRIRIQSQLRSFLDRKSMSDLAGLIGSIDVLGGKELHLTDDDLKGNHRLHHCFLL